MATALDMIQDAFEKLGVYAPGETVSAADSKRALIVLNDMMDSWSNEALSCFCILEQSVVMQPGISAYTIGPGGMVNSLRPLKLIDGPGAAYIQDDNQNNYPVQVVPRDVWNLIGTRVVNSNVPDTLFYDPQQPLGVLNVFPVPNISWTLFFDSYQQLMEFASLTTQINLPVGYKKAIQDNLAIELQPYFQDSQISSVVIATASKSKGNIKRTNIREVIAVYDQEIVSNAPGSYNIYSDRNY